MSGIDDMAAFDEDDVSSVAEKMAGLDLSDREIAALVALLSDDDVGGYGRFNRLGGRFRRELFNFGVRNENLVGKLPQSWNTPREL